VALYAEGVARHAPGTARPSRAAVVRASLQTRAGTPGADVAPGDDLSFVVTYRLSGENNRDLEVGFYLADASTGTRLYNATANDLGLKWQPPAGPVEITVEYAFRANLLRGAYLVTAFVRDSLTQDVLDRVDPAAHLVVHETFSLQGCANLDVRCRYLSSDTVSSGTSGDHLVGSPAGR
jgi:hypothetical protein